MDNYLCSSPKYFIFDMSSSYDGRMRKLSKLDELLPRKRSYKKTSKFFRKNGRKNKTIFHSYDNYDENEI